MSDSQLPPVPRPASEFEKTVVYSPADSAAVLVNVLDQYLADLQAGKMPDREQLLADHPELAHQLADCLAGIEFVHQAAKSRGDIPSQLGDFLIVREVGRGGMGVVYEAEQVSLKRRVALKVLRFGVTTDAEVMQRFQREAETVAHLHHTNIVPIHAVGCEQGVHYYAMQFIEGQSLAAVLEQLGRDRSGGEPVDFRHVADWMLQAAEALAHAHQRGVIHRDIKPSNLILDPEGTVWLTDFGLAKRADEVTMTAAGILMGTPRYMSPEQAAAARQPVDHRTDIYSLGATLYELATGKPVFDGSTPQGVITQILNAEPVSPRLLQGTLPRDLETVILKCLAKDPGQRYQHARDLADDLRAYLDNRPIRARRATLRERAVRWARTHQRSSIVSAVTAAASLLVIVGSWFSWQLYHDSRQGRMLFTTDGPTLVAEVFNSDVEPVVAGFPVPTPQPVTVPAGPYQVRFSSAGLLSETWQLNVDRGGPQTFPVKLMDRQLGPPINVAGTEPPYVFELDGQTHVVHRGERGWRLLKGETMKSVWQADLFKFLSPAEIDLYPRSPFNDGGADLLQVVNTSGQSPVTHSAAPALVSPAADLNGDGKQDLIFASRISSSLLAVSGATGDVLWWHRAASHLPAEHDVAQDPLDPKTSSESAAVIGQPELVMLNGEPVVVAVYVSMSSHLRTMAGKDLVAGRKFSVEAVAARTGKTLWRSVFDLPEFATKAGYEIAKLFPSKPTIRPLNGRDTILLHVGTHLFAWELETGRECWPSYELGALAVQFAQFSDLDGDDEPEALLAFLNEAQSNELTLKAISLKSRELLWEHIYRTTRSLYSYDLGRAAGEELAWTVDLNGDGRSEVLIPVADDWGKWGKHWYGLELLDGATGTTRWQQRLRSIGQFSGSGIGFPVQVLVGPDLDGDGHAEVFATSISSRMDFGREATAVQIDALSGQDGRRFWRQRQEVAADRSYPPAGTTPPRWWQTGDDGWPRLIVPVSKGVGGQPISYVIASHTGQLTQTLPEVTDPHVADINSDGIPDIWYITKSQDARRMTVLQGMPPVNWRRPGVWRPASDFDADGTADFLEFRPKHLAGRSGLDGHVLWEVEVSRHLPVHSLIDLNGDGVDDVVIMISEQRRVGGGIGHVSYEYPIVLAGFSGKSGERIRTSQDCGLNDGSSSQSGGYPDDEYSIPAMGSRDLDGDGQSELIVAARFDDGLMLAAFSSRDGLLLWKLPVDEYCLKGRDVFERLFRDLNGDGVLDVVISAPKTRDGSYDNLTVAGLRAYSGRDGQSLWKEAPADRFPLGAILRVTHPVLGDLDGDGIAEVVLVASERNGADPATGLAQCELIVLDGRSGERKWSWPWQTDGQFNVWQPTLVNLDGDKTRCICVGIHEVPQNKSQLILLNSSGVERRRIAVSWVDFWSNVTGRDLDGDGRDELLFHSESQLQAYRERDQTVLWKQPVIGNWYRLHPPSEKAGSRSTILAFKATNGAAFGLDAATGAVRWRADPLRQENRSMNAELSLPADPHERAAIISVDAHGQSTLAQHAWPTEASGRYRAPVSEPLTYAKFDDPDRFRPLPWVPPTSPGGKLLVVDLTFTLLLVMAIVVRSLVWMRRHRWRLAFSYLMLAPLISLLMAVILLWTRSSQLDVGEQYAWSGWPWILLHGAVTLGAMTIGITILVWVTRRLWRWLSALRARS